MPTCAQRTTPSRSMINVPCCATPSPLSPHELGSKHRMPSPRRDRGRSKVETENPRTCSFVRRENSGASSLTASTRTPRFLKSRHGDVQLGQMGHARHASGAQIEDDDNWPATTSVPRFHVFPSMSLRLERRRRRPSKGWSWVKRRQLSLRRDGRGGREHDPCGHDLPHQVDLDDAPVCPDPIDLRPVDKSRRRDWRLVWRVSFQPAQPAEIAMMANRADDWTIVLMDHASRFGSLEKWLRLAEFVCLFLGPAPIAGLGFLDYLWRSL